MKLTKAEFEAVIQASQRTFVRFHQLVLSVDSQSARRAMPSGADPRHCPSAVHLPCRDQRRGGCATEPAQQRTDGIAEALELDMTKWWSAAATSYFEHGSKARAAQAIGEATGIQLSAAMRPLKKDAAVAYVEQAVAGKNWLPTILRVRAVDDRLASSQSAKGPERGAQDAEPEDACLGWQAGPAYVASAVERCGDHAGDDCTVED